jgi:hypothetical protein
MLYSEKCGIKDGEIKEYPKKFVTGRLKKSRGEGVGMIPALICS